MTVPGHIFAKIGTKLALTLKPGKHKTNQATHRKERFLVGNEVYFKEMGHVRLELTTLRLRGVCSTN